MNCQAGTLSDAGAVYEHTFTQCGTYSYFCFAHCEYGTTGERVEASSNYVAEVLTVFWGFG